MEKADFGLCGSLISGIEFGMEALEIPALTLGAFLGTSQFNVAELMGENARASILSESDLDAGIQVCLMEVEAVDRLHGRGDVTEIDPRTILLWE